MSKDLESFKYPSKVKKESQSPEMKKRMSNLKQIEERAIESAIPMNDADYFEQLWNEVE
ncbi:MAG: hypothetical protein ABJF16_15460 [Lentilitoribacter sp.]